MTDWNLPPKGGHMDLPDGIYLQNMSIAEIKERVKKAIIKDNEEFGNVEVHDILNHEDLEDLSGEVINDIFNELIAERFIVEDGYYHSLVS